MIPASESRDRDSHSKLASKISPISNSEFD